MTVEKRDNMGFAINPVLIVVIVMVAAAFVVACGAGISKFVMKHRPDDAFKERSEEQRMYMREVRARTMDELAYQSVLGQPKKPKRSPLVVDSPSTFSEV